MDKVIEVVFNEKQNEIIDRFVQRFCDVFMEVIVPAIDSGEIDCEWLMEGHVLGEAIARYQDEIVNRLDEHYDEIES